MDTANKFLLAAVITAAIMFIVGALNIQMKPHTFTIATLLCIAVVVKLVDMVTEDTFLYQENEENGENE